MSLVTVTSRAPMWQHQPELPPTDAASGPWSTPAARAFIEQSGITVNPEDQRRTLRLADVYALADRRREAAKMSQERDDSLPDNRSGSAGGHAAEALGTWVSADVVITKGAGADRAAMVLSACAAVLRGDDPEQVTSAVCLPDSTGSEWVRVVFDQISLVDVSAITRQVKLARAQSRSVDRSAGQSAALEVFDVAALGAARVLPAPRRGVMVVLGAAHRRVVPAEDGLVFSIAEVAEIWVHGGRDASPLQLATVLKTAIRAVSDQRAA